MRRVALAAVLVVLAGCTGGEEAPRPAASGPSKVVVEWIDAGKRSDETFALVRGGLAKSALQEPRVYARTGEAQRDQGIASEEVYFVRRGEAPRRLTHDRDFDNSPELLDDGRVTFVSCPISGGSLPSCSLDAIEPESRDRETLATDLGFVFDSDLSPDGSRLVVSRSGQELQPLGLFVITVESGDESRISDGNGAHWSPSGDRIAFVSDRDRNGRCLFHDCVGFAGEIYVADADGGNAQRLTNDPAVDAAVEWSGDGEWILFSRIPDEEDDWDLWAVRADGECERQLTDTRRWEIGAEWHGGGHGGLSC